MRKLRREVKIGTLAIGGDNPIAVQSMLNVPIRDLAGNVAQAKRLEAAGFPVVFHVHDEVVIDAAPEQASLEAVVEIMKQPPAWAPDLPLNADGWIGGYYRKD